MADATMGSSSSAVSFTVLDPEPSAVGDVRELVRQALVSWRVDSIADDVVLVASELVSNAVQHGREQAGRCAAPAGRVEFDLVATGSHLVCTVTDSSPEPPVRREVDESSVGGRGLQLIEALSMCWGWTPGDASRGKSVWAVFPIGDPLPRAPRPALHTV